MITIQFQANTAAELREQINDYLGETVVKVESDAIQAESQPTPFVNVVSTSAPNQPVADSVELTWQPGGGLVNEQPLASVASTPAPQPVASSAPVKVATQPAAVTAPVAPVKEYTLEEIQRALQPLMDAGRTQDIVDIMTKYGVAALTNLPKEQYPNVVNDIRALGAHI